LVLSVGVDASSVALARGRRLVPTAALVGVMDDAIQRATAAAALAKSLLSTATPVEQRPNGLAERQVMALAGAESPGARAPNRTAGCCTIRGCRMAIDEVDGDLERASDLLTVHNGGRRSRQRGTACC
jgi:hypothetical protein